MFKPPFFLVLLCAACGSNFTSTGSSGGSMMAGAGPEPSGGSPSAEAGSSGVSAGGASGGAAEGGAASGSGGSPGPGAGSGGAPDCAAMIKDYRAAVEKARTCVKGVNNQCSAMSILRSIGCGCPVLVNAKSPFTTTAQQKDAEIQAAHCDEGPMCDIACQAYMGAECASQGMSLTVCSPTN